MSKLTPEQMKKLDKLMLKFSAKSLWNGIHHGLLAAVMNIVLFMGIAIFFGKSDTVYLMGSVVIGIFIINRILKTYTLDVIKLKEEADKIIKS
jgi:hypothetical protein